MNYKKSLERILSITSNLKKHTDVINELLFKESVEHQIKCTKKIKLNAKRNNVKFNSIQII